jgi:UDP-2,3-diacylglucosamine pyrophosphatase LpxH
MAQDPKLLDLSAYILDKVIADLLAEHPKVVLIPGDLTKDGEKISHQSLAKVLKKLTNAGIKVFVIPGNHDINNPESFSFSSLAPTETITANEFASIYYEFGYKNSIRDQNSMSYIQKINGKLWLLGIDDCKYAQNTTAPIVSGAIKAETMEWIKSNLAEAKEKKIQVLAMIHHGVTEHYAGQNLLDPGFVVDNQEQVVQDLSDAGIKVVFTGHYHANDVTAVTVGDKILYDVETGSLVTWPSPYRLIQLSDNNMAIDTRKVTNVNTTLPGGIDFVSYSNLFHQAHLDGYFNYVLQLKYGVPPIYAAIFAPWYRDAIMAHYAGDEVFGPVPQGLYAQLYAFSPILAGALGTFYTDLSPTDNQLSLEWK